ncbi:MAG: CehA/McbA family metallohydrolase [Actinobacteria bacterium]|nr:CehA/McbA family metallohydrolase [Actinomycetota bacterium]
MRSKSDYGKRRSRVPFLRHRLLAMMALFLPLAVCLALPCGCGAGEPGPAVGPGPGTAGEMHFYFGNLHGHTEYSDGAGTPAEAYAWARDVVGFDFFAVTDHGERLSQAEWEETGVQADAFDSPGEFTALRGFEWSRPELGHVVVLGTEDFTGSQTEGDLPSLYAWIAARDATAQFNHPGEPVGCFDAFAFHPEAEGCMCLLETGNKDEGNNDDVYYPYYHQALDRGWRVAPAANQDNHRLSANSHRTVIVAPELTRGALLDALRARRAYATDDPDMRVTFRLGEEWMGSTVTVSSPAVSFLVEVEDDESIAYLELFTNGGRVVARLGPEAAGNGRVTWNPEVPVSGDCYFYLRVTERDEDGDDDSGSGFQVAVTAPIWLRLDD